MIRKISKRIIRRIFSEKSVMRLIEFLSSIKNGYRTEFKHKPSKEVWGSPPYKLNIGCGKNIKKGCLNIDLKPLADLCIDVRQALPFPDNSCHIIYAEHFLEHLAFTCESLPFLKECFRVLGNGGVIHIGIPDS